METMENTPSAEPIEPTIETVQPAEPESFNDDIEVEPLFTPKQTIEVLQNVEAKQDTGIADFYMRWYFEDEVGFVDTDDNGEYVLTEKGQTYLTNYRNLQAAVKNTSDKSE